MQPQQLLAWHCEHVEWVIVAQVRLYGKRKAREIVERTQMLRLDRRLIEFAAKVGNLGIGAFERLFEAIELQRRKLAARHAFSSAIKHERHGAVDRPLRRHGRSPERADAGISASWQNPSRFHRRTGNARPVYRGVIDRESLVVPGAH